MVKKGTLTRTYGNSQTEGELVLRDAEGTELLRLFTLELRWRNNLRKVSCIPEGEYQVLPRTSPKYGKHFEVANVYLRSFILIHAANRVTQLKGCIAPGLTKADLNGDGLQDVTNSKPAMAKLLELAPEGFLLTITHANPTA